jgi:hypothetical protein
VVPPDLEEVEEGVVLQLDTPMAARMVHHLATLKKSILTRAER